jgi:hypothetical protein
VSVRARLVQRLIPTRHPAWRAFAAAVGGEFRERPFWASDEVVTRFREWVVHVDTVMLDPRTGALKPGAFYSTRRGTQVWADFSSVDGFRFAIRDRRWAHANPWNLEWDIDPGRLADAVASRLGALDVSIGNAAFDDRYTIRSNQPDKVQRLFSEGSTVERLLARPELAEIRIAAAGSQNIAAAQPATLIAWERQLLQDVRELRDLHDVVTGLLTGLARLGSATSSVDPPA